MNDSIIYGHSPDDSRALGCEFSAEGSGIAMGGQIHDRLGAHVDRGHDLFHFFVIISTIAGNSQVDIDFGTQHGTDALRIQTGMLMVGTDDHLSLGDQIADLFAGAVFLLGYGLHLGRDVGDIIARPSST